MKYASFFHKLNNSPVAILPDYHKAIFEKAGDIMAGDFDISELFDDVLPVYEEKGNCGIINMQGVILPTCSKFEKMLGACSLKEIRGAIKQAKNSNVENVIFNIYSPGGVVQGVKETAKAIIDLGKTKNTKAYSDDLNCSAAYWLSASTKEIFCSESAIIGSIGVYLSLLTFESNLEQAGVKAEVIKAGKYKTLGIAVKDLTDEEREYLQAGVNQTYEEFKSAVSGRGLDDSVMQGETYSGDKAASNGLADGNISSLDELISFLNA